MRESNWHILNSPNAASRENFMSVLKNLRRILVRATLSPNAISTAIADVSMDTAGESYNSALPAANGVEVSVNKLNQCDIFLSEKVFFNSILLKLCI